MKERLYKLKTTNAEEPSENVDTGGNLESLNGIVPEVILHFLAITTEVFHEIEIDMTFINSLVRYKIKTCN